MKSLKDSVQVLAGVGPKRVSALKELGILTIDDLLSYYPFRYEDYSVQNLGELVDQQKVTLQGIVATEPTIARFGRQKVRVNFRLLVGTDSVMVTFFNQPWIKKQISANSEILVYGKWDGQRRSLAGMKVMDKPKELEAIYNSNKNIRQSTIKQLISEAYDEYQNAIVDFIPEGLIQHYRLQHRKEMIYNLHFPNNPGLTKAARRSAMFEEFFVFQMGLQWVKHRETQGKGISIEYDQAKVLDFIKKLPFNLTDAQKRVTREILSNMKQPIHMNRLLQGDVGSGKTVVAAVVMYAVVTTNQQAVLMAPTEILAEQHANNLVKFFQDYDVNIALLVGGTKKKVRQNILNGLADGSVDIVVGTHALIQDDVKFNNLALAITDEQHRFGVNQRQKLRIKGSNPDILAMTATPIPRTLAITAYGEMDISIIDQLPSGRKPIITRWLKNGEWPKVVNFMKQQFQNGHQAFLITPLIEESEAMDLRNAMELYEQLQTDLGNDYSVGLLHGKMKADEKDRIMADFKAKKFQALVSTTVIEVGVDIPNATLMIIHDADRFGLAQLHQLRGRVGRGSDQAYCILMADPKNKIGQQRMEIMVETNDGFKISEADLKMRGQGDVFGKQQSGLPSFKMGDPVGDLGALQAAQIEASKIVSEANWVYNANYANLVNYLNDHLKLDQSLD